MTERCEIRNGQVVTPDGTIEDGRVVVAGDRIERVDRSSNHTSSGATSVDATGCVVMPGLVDLHGDDIEHHHAPRSGATVDVSTAVTNADRANLLSGVTTKFHAVAFEDAPDGGRSLEAAEALATELASESYTLGDNRLHARCELTETSVHSVERLTAEVAPDLFSVMHHAPGEGQYDTESFERHYVEDRNWPQASVEDVASDRSSLAASERAERVQRIVALAGRAAAPVASHDDGSPAAVEAMAEHGLNITEYPLTLAAARRADEIGQHTVMGAPNLVRGGSLWDNLDARTAVDEGLVGVLCADYHPPSLLAAPFVDTGEPLATRVNRVTRNPADAVGLGDRGRIQPGARADIVVVSPAPTPTVERVFVGGSEAIRTGAPEAGTEPQRSSIRQ